MAVFKNEGLICGKAALQKYQKRWVLGILRLLFLLKILFPHEIFLQEE